MRIELKRIKIQNIVDGYKDNNIEGVVGYGGKLNIRPKYQREFVYDVKKRNAVIDTINKEYPLNVMYWVQNDDGTYEVLDGQQRTISFCRYVQGDFSINNRYFHNLTKTEQDKILNYECMIYFCQGNDKEKLEWFKVINIGGEKLTDQELRNAVYTGPWLSDAKLKFSKPGCAAYSIGKEYINGKLIRQEFLETAISWISSGNIEKYMSEKQHDPNANELWMYFRNVIDWVRLTFEVYRSEMKSINWGSLYNKYKDEILDTKELETQISKLMLDDDVTNKKGIYQYVLNGEEKHLNIRKFTDNQRREAYERQKGICPICKKHFDISEMEADHITPWSAGGKTNAENCQMLCGEDNRRKSNI